MVARSASRRWIIVQHLFFRLSYFTMEIDSEMLIIEVQNFPCIYDPRCEDYKNRISKQKAWMEIIRNITEENVWNNLTNEQKNHFGE